MIRRLADGVVIVDRLVSAPTWLMVAGPARCRATTGLPLEAQR